MRKLLRILLLTVLLTAALCISAAAADTVTGAGFYGIGAESGVTITPAASTGTVTKCNADVNGDSAFEEFYAGSDKLDVSVSGLTSGQQYLVLLVSGNGSTITADSICYIDQITADGTTGTFTVFPKEITETTELTLIITGSGGYQRKNISLSYTTEGTFERQPYVLGDINEDRSIDSDDALLALKQSVHLVELTATQQLAANVNGDANVDSDDALLILKYSVHLITNF